jgi:hypothetical protein
MVTLSIRFANRNATTPTAVVACSALASLLFFASGARGADLRSGLPKTGPTEQIVVLDVTRDKQARDSDAALLAIGCLQGLANRNSTKKIYLKNFPIRIYHHPESQAGPGDFYQAALDDKLIPYPAVEPKLDASSSHPVLLWLLGQHDKQIRGKTLYEPRRHGQVAAAVNACTFEEALPLTDSLDRQLQANGIAFALANDLRKLDDKAALEWSLDRHLAHPQRNRQVTGFGPGVISFCMVDYWVATGSFTYYIRGEDDVHQGVREDSPTKALFAKVLNTQNFQPGAPSIGPVEGGHAIPYITKTGYSPVCGEVPNASLTSSIPLAAARFHPAPRPAARPIDNSAVYLSFHGNDGDAIDWCLLAYKNLRSDPEAGKVPMAWKINPHFVDLFPTLVAWFSCQHPDVIDVMFSMNDGGAPAAGAGRKYWEVMYARYFQQVDGSVQTACYLSPLKSSWSATFFAQAGATYVLCGYQGNANNNATQWLVDGAVASNATGMGSEGPEELYERIKDAVVRSKSGEPLFIMARLGIWEEQDANEPYNTRRGILPASAARVTMDLLAGDKTIGRKLVFLPPRDLAATYRAWATRDTTP